MSEDTHPEPFQPAPNSAKSMVEAMQAALQNKEIPKVEPKVEETKQPEKPKETPKAKESTDPKPKVSAFPEKTVKSETPSEDEPKPGTKEFNYKALETKAQQAAKEAEALRKQLAETKALLETNEWKTKAELIAKEKEDLSNRLMQASLERHPKFQAHYNSQFESISEKIKTYMPGEVGDRLAKAVKNGTIAELVNDPTVEEAIESLPTAKNIIIGPLLSKAMELYSERTAALANPQTHLEDASKVEAAKRQEWTSTAIKTFNAEKESAMNSISVFQRREGDNDWNSGVESDLQSANEIFNDITEGKINIDDLSRVVLWSKAAPKLNEIVEAQTAMIAKLTEKVKAMEGAQPGITNKGGSSGGIAKPVSFMDAVQTALGR